MILVLRLVRTFEIWGGRKNGFLPSSRYTQFVFFEGERSSAATIIFLETYFLSKSHGYCPHDAHIILCQSIIQKSLFTFRFFLLNHLCSLFAAPRLILAVRFSVPTARGFLIVYCFIRWSMFAVQFALLAHHFSATVSCFTLLGYSFLYHAICCSLYRTSSMLLVIPKLAVHGSTFGVPISSHPDSCFLRTDCCSLLADCYSWIPTHLSSLGWYLLIVIALQCSHISCWKLSTRCPRPVSSFSHFSLRCLQYISHILFHRWAYASHCH